MAHRTLCTGENAVGDKFVLMHYGNHVQLIWTEELNINPSLRSIKPGEDPQEIANEWKEEITNCVF